MRRGIWAGVIGRSVFAVAPVWILAMLAAGVAQATTQTLTVTTTADSGPGSLREAITTANGDTGDTIIFNITGPGPFTIRLTSGPLPTITSSMNIMGGATQATGITISGGSRYGVLSVGTSGARDSTLNLNHLTIAHGWRVSNSPGGAGIFIHYATLVNVTNCTFLDNNAGTGYGGAILDFGPPLNVTNSTFSENRADSGGGAIYTPGTINVTNSTFSGNRAEFGGIINTSDTVNLKGTILAANTGGNCSGPIKLTDKGYNISDDFSCGFDKTGSADNGNGVDPGLNSLASNGGPTMTFALKSNSPAIDAIPPADCTYLEGPNPCTTSGSITNQLTCDQRGFIRPALGQSNCDIGAVEGVAAPTLGAPGGTCEDDCKAQEKDCTKEASQSDLTCLIECRDATCNESCRLSLKQALQECLHAQIECQRKCAE